MFHRFMPFIGLLFLPCIAGDSWNGRHLNIEPHAYHLPIDAPRDHPVKDGVVLPAYDTIYTFDQLIDHDNPDLGTFKQRYYFSYEYYEEGGPIILSTPGEGPLEGHHGSVTNGSINGVIAQANNAAAVMIEHRFFGQSNPYPDLSEESFRVHTLEQTISDLVYFATNAVLPMPGGDSVGADKAPWILIGGSYAGALVSWTMNARPGVFWAGYSSSGVVQAISYYWGYFEPIRQYMPKNCSADIERVIKYMDRTLVLGSQREIDAFKAQFGVSDVTHLDDIPSTLLAPLQSWQNLSPRSAPNNTIAIFCDTLEIKDGVAASANGWGLKHALKAYGGYVKNNLARECGKNGNIGNCINSRRKYLNVSINQWSRSWMWLCCNYVGYWQDGAPSHWPTIVSRLVTPARGNRECGNYFPKTFPTETSANPKTEEMNAKYGGWNTTIPRIFFANGKRDPWREATVSSDFINRPSTPSNPIAVSDGYHCTDLSMKNTIDPSVAKVQQLAVQYFVQWVNEYNLFKLPPPANFNHEVIPVDIVNAPPSGLSRLLSQVPI
ncbi:hypothetical protein BOTBODRAFT_345995 [Botryobasidium botryosum FD-172 SS1]|uniref:Peptidase S28 n=1 Tax=Botryobasidium botryosum (strain FD-172 SS1) TaxID=930990 RepID=A0A067MSK7_BOTB1|nr:hypothetical protein BOTBODRAFT_345995 [Botryobasidium botryosum FD-172 SS1]